MLLGNPFPNAFGLDIGDLSIKLVQLKHHEPPFKQPYFSLQEVRSVTLPPGVILNGEIEQPEIVRKKILHLLEATEEQHAIMSRWVVADLPEPRTFLKLIEIDTPEKKLMFEDVAYYAKKHLPFELEETYLDWEVLSQNRPGDKTVQVLVAAVPKIIADSYTYLLEAAGLNPIALEIEALAITRATLEGAPLQAGNDAFAILDIGATRSSLIIYDHDRLQFSTNIDFSGELITVALTQGLKIEYAAAERLKRQYGLQLVSEHPHYLKIISDLIEGLLANIRKDIEFYREHFPDAQPITHVILTGGAALLKNIDVVLAQKLRITTELGNPWHSIRTNRLLANNQADALSLTSAIGLAMRAATNPLEANNL